MSAIHKTVKAPGIPESLTYAGAARLLSDVSGVTFTYHDVYTRLHQRAPRRRLEQKPAPRIKKLKASIGRTRNGRRVRTRLIRITDLPLLADRLGVAVTPDQIRAALQEAS